MRGAFAAAAVLAWLMFQVPLVLCQSECGSSCNALFLLSHHSCHDEHSDAHLTRCGRGHHWGHRHAGDRHAGDGQHGENHHHDDEEPAREDGEHVLVTVMSPTAPVALGLPALAGSFAARAISADELASARTAVHAPDMWGDLGPPACGDPVSTADRLLV
jgi:hypothetical protein